MELVDGGLGAPCFLVKHGAMGNEGAAELMRARPGAVIVWCHEPDWVRVLPQADIAFERYAGLISDGL